MDTFHVTYGLAILAGIASFLSPCVLALVPAYIGYLGGRAAGGENTRQNRIVTFLHGLAFVVGFSLVFVGLNILGYGLGRVFYDIQYWLARVGGFIVVIFGLHMMGVFRIPFLEYDTRVQSMPDRKLGYLSSAMMGVFFSAGWSPCVGPVLGFIITLSITGQSLALAAGLGTAYSAGLAIPFLAAAVGVGWVSTLLSKYNKIMRYTEIGMGALMVVIGVMLMFGYFNILAGLFPNWTPDL